MPHGEQMHLHQLTNSIYVTIGGMFGRAYIPSEDSIAIGEN